MMMVHPHNENDVTAVPQRRPYIKASPIICTAISTYDVYQSRKPKAVKIVAKAIKSKASSPTGIMPIEVRLLLPFF